ncbi:metallophosphoesterase [Rhizobium rhododendri]|uniref:Metallophosphoesterase n=1 Tax=Rhizobium rhododendri TaxID=2506430 RepID=A0ABY8IKM0_9HYPH|nr:metallophosphoesterase [Rhizobium rhododendri]WFS23918.1 metallophosphoesterase [Rhizobium rhododendri]
MKCWILSDLHLEFSGIAEIEIPNADVCIVAGDIQNKGIANSLQWLDERIAAHMPTVVVAGNHEFYRAENGFDVEIALARGYEPKGKLWFLENSHVEIDSVVFVGATLWTDFDVLGEEFSGIAMRSAATYLNDYRLIKDEKEPFRRIVPGQMYQKHVLSLMRIEQMLAVHRRRKRIIVTHHAPSIQSVEHRYLADMLTPSFASNLEDTITRLEPALWVHGHVHHHVDYIMGNTRVVANPRGYPKEPCYENYDFGMVVEI